MAVNFATGHGTPAAAAWRSHSQPPGRLAVLARAEQLNTGARVMGSGYIDDMVQEATRTLRVILGPGRTIYHIAATQFAFLVAPDIDEEACVAQLGLLLEQLCAASNTRFVMSATCRPRSAWRLSSQDRRRRAMC